MLQTLDQKRAKHAWERVEKLGSGFADVKNHVKKVPTRILNSGLAPTIAFMRAKGEAVAIVDAIESWVNAHIPGANGEPEDLFERILNNNSEFLRRVTDESMAYLQWYVRFVEAKAKSST